MIPIYHSLSRIAPCTRRAVVSIGNFDGVHRGHQQILGTAVAEARKLNARAIAFTFDGLDGAVARMRGLSSRYGGYLDAVVDRYQELVVYITLALVTGWWLLCLLAITGSLMTSYNKARTAVEIPIDNNAWPDLLERLERVAILCAALVFDPLIHLPRSWGASVLSLAILLIGVLSHVTAIQRFIRARGLILRQTRN